MLKSGMLILLLSLLSILPQNTNDIFYLESWKKGGSCIEESRFLVEINLGQLNYENIIKDCDGKEKYRLAVIPHTLGEGVTDIQGCLINLSGKEKDFGDEDLLTSSQYSKNELVGSLKEDNFGLFVIDLNQPSSVLPFHTTRVVKVENFYCIMKLVGYEKKDLAPGLSSISIEIQFTNVLSSTFIP